ncbi:serine hydrolase domain-containing protein [Nocardioides sp.]|uniref:serine hydrolase domain-containing protein n=1 Tax=Nocardioides sp. TaxID=35761 RepID=UPI002BC1AB24|nr:serine hydrolase domain-containing protein [Nocardioides sp.]HXH78879.1 serine hydrolase domain-containing protein [Nocardioides sp.]
MTGVSEARPSVQAEVDRGVRRRAGLVIGVLSDGETSVCGRAADGGRLDGSTLFEIGSVTKTFTSLLLADGVVRGDWSLGTPVRDLLPAGVTVPAKDGVEITLEHLATHTSGLPSAPLPIVPGTLKMLRGHDPYAGLTEDGLLRALGAAKLRRTPGSGSMHYSNLGVAVLGAALAHAVGRSYADLVVERICDPLGLADTRVDAQLSAEQRSRLVPGHRGRGKPTAAWPLEGLPAAGALRSSTDDLLLFLTAQLHPDQSPLAKAIRLAHVRRKDPRRPIGLGWMRIDRPELMWWHNGGTGGYRSFVGFRPGRRDGVVALSNHSHGVDRLALRALRSLD